MISASVRNNDCAVKMYYSQVADQLRFSSDVFKSSLLQVQ